ncbi:MAG: ABC transporter substrate-binding protein, partial [Candidatus Binatia bacterium]
NPVRGLAAAKKMISDGVSILTGLYCSTVAATLLPEVERAQIPLVLSGTLTARTVDPLNKQVFRVVSFPNSRDIAFARASYWIEQIKAKRIAFFHQADELGRSDIESTRAALEKYQGWEILALPINVGDTDFTAQILKAREWKPDLVYMNALPKEGSLLVKQGKELGLTGQYWGGGSLTTGAFYEAVGDLATGMLLEISFSDEIDADTPAIKAVTEKLIARFGKGPGRPNVKALSGYYSFKVLAEGLKLAGRDLTREKLIAAMETMKDVNVGIGYPVTLSPTNHEGTNTLTIYKVVSATKREKATDITWQRR